MDKMKDIDKCNGDQCKEKNSELKMNGDSCDNKLMWSPPLNVETQQDQFRHRINKKFGLNLKNFQDLYDWSVREYERFWEEFMYFSDIRTSQPHTEVCEKKPMPEIPQWFSGCRMNYAENLLKHSDDKKIAFYVTGESYDKPESVTFGELRSEVARFAHALRQCGISANDRVVGYLPNGKEALVAYLASASIGAIWSSTSPDFGVKGVVDRFSQINPQLIISTNRVFYNGKQFDHLAKIADVTAQLNDLKRVVIVPGNGTTLKDSDIAYIPKSCTLSDFLGSGDVVPPLHFEQLPFNHPLCILFSSGTTGLPKCMVHSAGGALMMHLKEHVLQGDLKSTDVMFYYTTIGWMMWNWLVSALAVGATLVLYDGSPFIPTDTVLWDLIDTLGITIFGTSAKWLAVSEDKDLIPMKSHKLTSLHTILSTGSPLLPRSFDYVYEKVKRDVCLGSISGGSDIVSCFVGQNRNIPVYRGEVQSRNLGLAIESFDDNGKAVYDVQGELVCTKPFPSMPVFFWNDLTGEKYQNAYFKRFSGVWHHGDFCLIRRSTGGVVMLGRSDATLNPNGVRFGSVEIYNIVEKITEISDSVCVSYFGAKDGEERVILFLKMAAGHVFDDVIVNRVKCAIRSGLSPRHVPTLILETADIPYTINGKKIEMAVKKILAGETVDAHGSIANPQSLECFKNIAELAAL